MLVGKTFWKVLALPCILYASEIITYTVEDIKKLQRIDNRAYRYILQVPIFTAAEFLRGEIGTSSSESRDMKNKILFLKHCFQQNSNKLLKEIMIKDLEKKQTDWVKQVYKYLDKVKLDINQIKSLSINLIIKKIHEWDLCQWQENMTLKSTLTLYRNNKNMFSEVKWMKNGYKYSIMLRARSDSLDLEWRVLNLSVGKLCKLCMLEIETLEHFLLFCNKLQVIRNNYIHLQWPAVQNKQDIIKKILLFEEDEGFNYIYFIDMLYKIWNKRENLLKEIN